MSYRNRDMVVEQEIAKFLDENFYMKVNNIKDFHRHTDRDTQLKGVDCRLIYKDNELILDEKAMSHYINQNLPTFAFELGSYQKSGYIDGWLIDDTKDTTHYLLIWITTIGPCEKKALIFKEDIKKLECLLIGRQDIINYLDSHGFPREKLIKKRDDILKQAKFGPIDKDYQTGFYFFNTSSLVEAPVNVIIKKPNLMSLKIDRWIVTRDSIEIC
tara:strand:- start:192 stop:836 length:645 start_codon:yes stop_codon:yes gene_type:complete